MDKEQSLQERLRSWLDKEGYPLEMQVCAALRRQDFWEISPGWCYTDIESDKSREIDVVATASEPMGVGSVQFAFECKATGKPWVLFTSEDTGGGYSRLHAFGLRSKQAHDLISSEAFSFGRLKPDVDNDEVLKTLKLMFDVPWFWQEGNRGYALAQAFGGDSSVPYGAVQAAVKACRSFFDRAPQYNNPPRIHVAFPVVVTSGPLFECWLNESGEPELRQVTAGTLFYQQRVADIRPHYVHIVTVAGIDDFLAECRNVVVTLLDVFKPEVIRLTEGIGSLDT